MWAEDVSLPSNFRGEISEGGGDLVQGLEFV